MEAFLPDLSPSMSLPDLSLSMLYAFYRFTSAPLAALAKLAGVDVNMARSTLARIRADRLVRPDCHRLLWSLEWSLRWRLHAAPHRP
jgi:hypothetical protein